MEGKTEKFIEELKRVDAQVFVLTERELNEKLRDFLNSRGINSVYLKKEGISFELNLGDDIKVYYEFKEGIPVGITEENFGIAYSGGLVEFAENAEDKQPSLLPDIHIAILREKNIVEDISDFFERIEWVLQDIDITFIVGPSKTADIEKILVKGAHGPRELVVFIVR